jgi:hypothetical protein
VLWEQTTVLGEVMPLQFTSTETQQLSIWMNTESSDKRAAEAAQQLRKLLQGRGVRTVDFLLLQKQATPTAPVRQGWNGTPQDYELGFGKYKGKRLAEIPKDYLVWSLDNANGLWPQTREANRVLSGSRGIKFHIQGQKEIL